MTYYRCTRVDCDSRMFSEGRIYQHIEGHNSVPTVRDDLGHLRVIGFSLKFIVRNDCPRVSLHYYAHFEEEVDHG